ncbi:MAG: DUF4097 family beta strand repeat-containing protein [Jatrophihabitantaceae bacterium]
MTTQTFPLTAAINLQVRTGTGSLVVMAQDDLAEAVVTLTARSQDSDIVERTVVELTGPTLSVTTPRQGGILDLPIFGGRRDRDAIDITVTVPSGTAIKASSYTADISVRGRCGGADLTTGAADISVEHVDGDLRIRYGSGSCSAERVEGSVTSRSGSGRARFGTIGGSLNAGCGSGELTAESVGGTVHARAGSGGATLGSVRGDVDLGSGSGNMSIGLPAGYPARLDVTTGSGRVTSDLPIEDTPAPSLSKAQPLTIRARTGSGDIRVFRAA